MYELGQGTVTYTSAWNVTGGTIELSIEKAGYSDGVVIIRYRDKQIVKAPHGKCARQIGNYKYQPYEYGDTKVIPIIAFK